MEGKKQQNRLNRKLLVFPAPLQGHVTPMMHLANLLYSKGFSITVIQTPYHAIQPTHFPDFTFYFLDDGLLDLYSKTPTPDSFRILSDMNTYCLEPFRHCLSQILSQGDAKDQEPVACLIVDPMWMFAGDVANDFKLPRMALRTGSMTAFLVYYSLPSLRDKGYFSRNETAFDELLLEFPPLKVKDLPLEAQHDSLASRMKEFKTSHGVICNTFEELEGSSLAAIRKVFPTSIFPIGPLHKYSKTSGASIWTEDQTSIAWLDTQAPKSVLYVSFGSIAVMSKAEFLEIAWGLANSMQPFLWVVRHGLIQGSEEIDPFPVGYLATMGRRGHIVDWAPQLEVMSHPAVGGFWTHCGWNSTLESIGEGIPMISQPMFADQGMNGRQVCDKWKIGLQLEKGVKREEIENTIRKLMVEDEGQEMRNRITALKEEANLSVIEGGSSYKSLERLISYLLSC